MFVSTGTVRSGHYRSARAILGKTDIKAFVRLRLARILVRRSFKSERKDSRPRTHAGELLWADTLGA